MLKKSQAVLGLLTAAAITLSGCSETGQQAEGNQASGELTAEGATSQQRAMDLFATLFEQTGSTLSYNPTGSGSGQTQFVSGQVAFAGSDSPLGDQAEQAKERCGGNEAWHLPMVVGPVAIAYNMPGVTITLTPALVAEIFDGKITKWNDKKIAAVNEGSTLPEKEIKVVFRSEESGTSDNFMKFLSAAAPKQWPHEHSKSFPTTVGQGANGSSGVVDEVSQIDGAITYVEAGFAKDKGLGIASLDFGAGPVELNKNTVGNALDKVSFTEPGNNLVVDSEKLFAMKEPGAYPLVLTTYEIVCSAGYDDQTRELVKSFLTTVLEKGQSSELEALGYVPLQGDYKQKLADAVAAIQ